MTKSKFWLWAIIIMIIGMILQWYLCCRTTGTEAITPQAPEVVATPEPPAEPTFTNYPFTIPDGGNGFAYDTKNNIDFDVSSFKIRRPIDIGVKEGIIKLGNFLKENPDKAIDITGYYTDQEQYDGSFPNLGLARANAVKNYFVGKEISSKQINTFGELRNEMIPDGTIYKGPVKYGLNVIDTSEADAMKELGDKIRANPLVLYFKTGQASINLTTEERQKIADISRYLDKVDGAKTIVTGHTDSVGRRATNIRLGQERADFAKEYLISNGIPANKIDTKSKGPDKPVATNRTKDGRAKNRRTVITIN